MPRRKKQNMRQDALSNPFIIGLAALVAIMLISSASFNTPLIPFVGFGEGSTSLTFSWIGLPLLGLLLLVVVFLRLRK